MIDHTIHKLESLSTTLKSKGKWKTKLNQDNPQKINIKRNLDWKIKKLENII